MTTWDLNRLRYTVRKLTGKYDESQLPDSSNGENSLTNPAGIDDYINDFYLYDLPEHLRTLRLKSFYTFPTIPNCGTYAIPENVYSLEPPIYIDNYEFAWYQSPQMFYRIWPELNFIDRNLSGLQPDGIAQSFLFTLTQTPIQQGTVVIGLNPSQDGNPSPPLETFTDADTPIPLDIPKLQYFVNPGVLTGNLGGTGTIDYLTGVCTLNYATVPPAGVNSSCHYHPYVASRPRDIMFFQQQLFLRPIPNDSYSVKLLAYLMPTTVMNAGTNATVRPSLNVDVNNVVTVQGFTGSNDSEPTDLPQFNEWWQLIAYGTAMKIFIEDGDHEEYERMAMYFEKQKLLAQRKELRQLSNQRIQTAYSENNGMSGAAWPIFPLY